MSRKNRIEWDILSRRIKRGKLVPIIGDRVGHGGFLTSDALIQKWADKIHYPMANTTNITRVAQYRSITRGDATAAKEDYLDFLKYHLLDRARDNEELDEDSLDRLEDDIETKDLPFSKVAERLSYPNFDEDVPDEDEESADGDTENSDVIEEISGETEERPEEDRKNPLTILAQLPIPLYITTSFHPFMAQALRRTTNKEPRIEVCPWYPQATRTSLLDEAEYEDDPQRPVVYHLHGIDTEPESLVFSEDDYIDFLVRTGQELNVIPVEINKALASSSLLLLGYDLQDWDFRVLFRGLIRRKPRAVKSVCIQLNPEGNEDEDPEEIEHYLQTFFQKYEFDIYWGDADQFAQDLWEHVRGG